MGLDIALVGGLGVEFPFDNQIRRLETGLHVAQLGDHARRDVGRLVGRRIDAFGELLFVQERRVRGHGVDHVDDVRQHLVIHFDELHRRLGDGFADRRHGGHRMAVI